MIRPLVFKELREHWLAAAVIAALQLLATAMLAISESKGRGSPLDLVRMFTLGIGSLGAWAITHRLIAREYTSRTQLFLETLPVSRGRVFAVKWVLGALYVLGMLGLCLLIAVRLASSHEQVSGLRVALIAVRAGSFGLLIYAFLAALGLLGRYRAVCALFTVIALFALEGITNVDLSQVGPLLLVGDDLAYERHVLPGGALAITWGLIAALIALAFFLVLTREGNLQAMLAERMSHREKVFIGCIGVSLFFAIYLFDELKPPKPFTITQGAQVSREGLEVHVASRTESELDQAGALAEHVSAVLAGVRDQLALAALPAVSILPSNELDADVFERAKLHKRDGLVVRARVDAPDFDRVAFDAWLIGETITWASGEKQLTEDRQWAAEGFAWWWATRNAPEARRTLLLRGLYGADARPALETLKHWLSTRERLGPCVAGGVAASALEALRTAAGEDGLRAFLRASLGWKSPKSLRALWQRRPLEALLRDDAHVDPAAWMEAWAGQLARQRAGQQQVLPRLEAQLEVNRLSVASREARVRVLHADGQTPDGHTPYVVLYSDPGVIDGPWDAAAAQRQLNVLGDGAWHPLPQSFAAGDRLAWTVSMRVPALGCSVWSGVRREVLW